MIGEASRLLGQTPILVYGTPDNNNHVGDPSSRSTETFEGVVHAHEDSRAFDFSLTVRCQPVFVLVLVLVPSCRGGARAPIDQLRKKPFATLRRRRLFVSAQRTPCCTTFRRTAELRHDQAHSEGMDEVAKSDSC